MKKMIFSVLLTVLFWAFAENLHSQCPPGYSGPYTNTINLCETGCFVEINWCCKNDASPESINSIYINSIRFLTNPESEECSCLVFEERAPYLNPIPLIPMNRVIDALALRGKGCFTPIPEIPNCGDEILEIIISAGGCFEYSNTLEWYGYRRCEPYQGAYCQQTVAVCKYIYHTAFRTRTRLIGSNEPLFECTGNCSPLCRVFYYDE